MPHLYAKYIRSVRDDFFQITDAQVLMQVHVLKRRVFAVSEPRFNLTGIGLSIQTHSEGSSIKLKYFSPLLEITTEPALPILWKYLKLHVI